MEMAGFHARDTRDPGRTVPRAIALCVGVVVVFSVVGSLFLAMVVPASEISLVSGTMELFSRVLDRLGVGWAVAPLALVVAFGGIAHLAPVDPRARERGRARWPGRARCPRGSGGSTRTACR